MVYNYIAAMRIDSHRHDDGRMYVTIADAQEWRDERDAKAKAKYEQIQLQLKGEA